MVNPGIFKGARKDFLIGEKEKYKAGVDGGYTKDALAQIQRRFFKRFPVDLPLDTEPSPETLALVDDDAADDEVMEPNEQELGAEKYQEALKAFEERAALLKKRKAQITRWLSYQYSKDHDAGAKEFGDQNPYAVLLHQLTGIDKSRPRLQAAQALWRRTKRTDIEAETVRRAEELGIPKKNMAPIREKVVKEWFGNLLSVEKDEWISKAKAGHDDAMKTYNSEANAPVSTDPLSRQKAIQHLTLFAQPILDLICDATGWKTTLIAGGPEPADDGKLHCLAIHSGTTSGDIKMNFGRASQSGFEQHIFPLFCSFLRKCYTPEECKDRSLSAEQCSEQPTSLPSDDAALGDANSIRVDTHFPQIDTSGFGDSSQRPVNSTPSQTPPPSAPQTPVHSPGRESSPTLPSRQPSLQPSNLGSPSIPSSLPMPATGSNAPAPVLPLSANVTRSDPTTCNPLDTLLRPPSPLNAVTRQQQSQPPSLPTSAIIEVPSGAASRKVPKRKIDNITQQDDGRRSSKRQKDQSSSASGTVVDGAPEGRTTAPFQTKGSSTRSDVSLAKAHAEKDPGTVVPAWFIGCHELFNTGAFGDDWKGLLEIWSCFEAAYKYEEKGRLAGASVRPKLVSDWVKSARPFSWRPAISNLTTYESSMLTWWTSLQPNWRLDNKGKLDMTKKIGVITNLTLPGLNGILTFIAALYAWAVALPRPIVSPQWLALVRDVHFVLSKLSA